MTQHLTERQIERQITDYLALDNWRCIKTDPVSDRARGKGFGELGMADCLYLRYRPIPYEVHVDGPVPDLPPGNFGYFAPVVPCQAEVMFIEHKRPGQKPKQHQLRWHEAERACGALTLIAGVDFEASLDGFMAWYKTSGLMRRRIGAK